MKILFLNLMFFSLGMISFWGFRGINTNSSVFISSFQADGVLNFTVQNNSVDTNYLSSSSKKGSLLTVKNGVATWERFFIDEDLTLYVPSDFNTISEALDYLETKFIGADAIVTIQIEDGVYNLSSMIEPYHSEGKNINIVGNTTDPSQVVLNFTGVHGFRLYSSSTIGLIDGITLEGDNSCPCYGVYISDNSKVNIGKNMVIRNFEYGVVLRNNSYGSIGGLITNNQEVGLLAKYNSVATIEAGTISSFNDVGFSASAKSTIRLTDGSSADNNSSYGYTAWLFSTIWSKGASGNGTDFVPAYRTEGNIESFIR
jgi:hypothetical protein